MAIAVPNFSVDSQRGLAEMLWDWDPLLSTSHVKSVKCFECKRSLIETGTKMYKDRFLLITFRYHKKSNCKVLFLVICKTSELATTKKQRDKTKRCRENLLAPVSLTCTLVLYAFKCGATEDPQFLVPDLISAGLLHLRLAWNVIGCAKHTRCYRIGWLVFQSQVDIKLCSLKSCAVRSSRDPLVVGAFHVDAVWWLWLLKKNLFCLYSHWTVYDTIGDYDPWILRQ